jgi:hypothetical protein
MTIGARPAKPAARSGSTTRSRLGGALAVVVLALFEPARWRAKQQQAELEGSVGALGAAAAAARARRG